MRSFRRVLLLMLLSFALPVQAEHEVRVGAYHFPPYVMKPESARPQGLLPELLEALNAVQDDYRFILVPTSVTRRYRDFSQGRYDLIFFESPDWGWQDMALDKLDLQIADAEVYVARAEEGRGQGYFSSLRGKRMALYSGYHYGFAGFNADQNYLAREFNAVLTYSHDSNLLMLLHDRVDISVVTRSYLRLYQREHPEQSARLLISERADQVYHHHVLLRPGSSLDRQQLQVLLERLAASGRLGELLAHYRLSAAQDAASEQSDPMPR